MKAQQRTPFVELDDIPGSLPEGSVSQDTNLTSVAQETVAKLNDLQESHLAPNAIWRDLLSLTGYYRTIHSASNVYHTLTSLSQQKKRSIFRLKEKRPPRLARGGGGTSWVDVDVLFTAQHENLAENCMGTVSVIPDANGKWRIWMLRTWLESFDGHGHPDVLDPVDGEGSGLANGATNGMDGQSTEEYDAIIVGGGQAGLATAGRLKALGVSYLLIERHSEIGDNWGQRYESLRWHTSKVYGNLPFGNTFPAEDDYMLPAKRIGAGYKSWSEKYGIHIRTSTSVVSATYDENTQIWKITTSSPDGQQTLKARDLVLAIGPGHARPIYPSWATAEKLKASEYKGTLVHSFAGYHSAHEWAGKRGIVIGTANTAHDVAEDMANAQMETTIVQRSPTFIFPAEWLHHAEDIHYNDTLSTDAADRESFTYPNKIMREIINRNVWAGIKANPDRFDALERAGFKLDRYGDIYNNLYVRFGGHYVDIGCSARISKGEIKVKTQPVTGLTEDGLSFEDGSAVGADLIVLCTGFEHDFRDDAAKIVGQEGAGQMDDFWGTDHEGELRGLAKPAGHPHLYYHGGDVRMARFFSRFLALQLQANALGRPLKPFLE